MNQMIESYLARDEGKTLEFKENSRPLLQIVRTVIAFANTAGGQFDEQPYSEINSEAIDFRVASEFFAAVNRPLTPPKQRSLGLVVQQ